MGVKSLWSLLTPVGRPVLLETIEGKTLAIDSSIWIYQFQATMRDKEGRALMNAHVLGFLRRICKLLFYGIRPVFVFDGGAPVLKRSTITDRKKKKSGAAASHIKIAEKLLAAQMRREALDHALPPSSKGKARAPAGPTLLDENTVYLEDLDPSIPKTPSKPARSSDASPGDPSSSSKKKPRFHDHDPYRLPPAPDPSIIAARTSSSNVAPDPRLATEDELRAFIDAMRPSDLDVSSPAFLALPTEIQYEIVGDLRIKSRQTSYKRLANMLQRAPTALDFSKQQIRGLKQRNALTQQLLFTTDNIGKAGGMIPVRIASERNREYLLVKNEGVDGGWVLGIRDNGTKEKPIEIDMEVNDEEEGDGDEWESDMEMEEVDIPGTATIDPDLREYRNGLALLAIEERVAKAEARGAPSLKLRKLIQRREKTKLLFDFDEDEEDASHMLGVDIQEDFDDDDPELAFAIQQSLENHCSPPSGLDADTQNPTASSSTYSLPTHSVATPRRTSSKRPISISDDDDDLYASPSRLETALAIGNTGTSRRLHISTQQPQASMFGEPKLLTSAVTVPLVPSSLPSTNALSSLGSQLADEDDEEDTENVLPAHFLPVESSGSRSLSPASPLAVNSRPVQTPFTPQTESDDDMEEVVLIPPARKETSLSPSTLPTSTATPISKIEHLPSAAQRAEKSPSSRIKFTDLVISEDEDEDEGDGEPLGDWSRSPSPIVGLNTEGDPAATTPREPSSHEDTWDAAQEMDAHAEEGEFARFVSQVKGRNLDDVRAEIDQEIKSLNQQKKAAMRDSDDITQQMISQIMLMLRLFGIPYITAPMEAEAQCAALVSLGLVEGIITDDSDVFLFGGLRVFKNMFNQSKTVECFFLSDLGRELGLDRDTLVRLAYLLGSDYVEGLPGVGPVVAMELLREFPGEDGLHKFKDWWGRVQSGKDRAEDNKSKFRKRFKKKFKDLYLPSEWPNPAVRDAYYHPTVDESDEPFKWGMPDLDGLRGFLREELGWNQTKVDDLLLPIVQKVAKRGQATAVNKQSNLDNFFDVSVGGGTYAPRKRQAYASKRLQEVVSDFRNNRAKLSAGASSVPPPTTESTGNDVESNTEEGPAKKRRKTRVKGKGKARADEAGPTRKSKGAARGRGRISAASSGRKKAIVSETVIDSEDEDEDEYVGESGDTGSAPQLRPRPKPRPVHKGQSVANLGDTGE